VTLAELAMAGVIAGPGIGALVLLAMPGYRSSSIVNVAFCAVTLASAGLLYGMRPPGGDYLAVDDLNTVFLIVDALVGLSTSVFSAGYIAHELEARHLTRRYVRFYHAMYQFLMLSMNLALLSNNIGLMWVAVEAATLTTVVMVGIYRTPAALEAAWKYFILGSVGIALALFGTILVYLAAQPALGEGLPAMAWSRLVESSATFDPALLNLAFVFLLLGYGTKIGLAPMHAWLPDAHAEGPTPISAVLSGLLLNVALFALLRFKLIMAGNAGVLAPGPLMMGMGLVSLIFAGLMMYKRRDIKRLFAYSSIEHMGIITFAFGLGGPLANFAGLLHMAMHSLTKSAIFFGVGYVSQLEGTQNIGDIRGLTTSAPVLGWILVIAVAAIAGLPPFGVFTSEFLVVTSTLARSPWLAAPLVAGLAIAFGALMLRLHEVAFGDTAKRHAMPAWRLAPMAAHLALVAVAGVFIPEPIVTWFRHVARVLGG
jgi:hydrogenase-4 component F